MEMRKSRGAEVCVGCDYFNFVRILIERSLLKPDILYNFATLKGVLCACVFCRIASSNECQRISDVYIAYFGLSVTSVVLTKS